MTSPAPNHVQAGYVSVLLYVPSALKLALAGASRQSGRIQRDLDHQAIENFIAWHEACRRGPTPNYRPLYRAGDAIPLRMWIKKELLNEVERFARIAHIQRREFIYSALVRRFGSEA